jgi:alanine dehydrogenase
VIVGIPKEIKTREYRVALTPSGARELTASGHTVMVETQAGSGSGFPDEQYYEAGAEITDKKALFEKSELIVKVKEPLPEEYDFFEGRHLIFTYLHLAPNPELTDVLLKKNITALAYETLEAGGALPLLTPMSEIAGRMSPIVAGYFLQKPYGGEGVLPSGAAGVPPAEAVVIGAGVVGSNAVRVTHALGMKVTVINRGIERLRHLDELYEGQITTLPSSEQNVKDAVMGADIVVGAVLVKGEKAPVCVNRELVGKMKKGAVIVDVSIDQGGCFETSRPTTHENPVYEVDGVVHYCVANMPGAYPRTSTLALTNSTLPYIKKLASGEPEKLIRDDPALRSSVNTYKGAVVHEGLASSLGIKAGRL